MNALQRLLTFVLATKLYSDYSRSKAVSGKCTISTMFSLSMFSYGNDVFIEHVFVRQRCFLASNRWFAKQLPSCWRPSRDVAVTATSPSGKMVNCYELELAIARHFNFSATPSAVPSLFGTG